MQGRLELLPPEAHELWAVAEFEEEPDFDVHTIRDFNELSGHLKIREISAPNDAMRALHQSFLARLRQLDIRSPYATGGFPGSSPARNVERHADNRYFYQLDLSSAYLQVDPDRLGHILSALDKDRSDPDHIASWLRKYCCHESGQGLLTGSPSSPDLFNVYLLPLDQVLGELAERHGLTYGRYIDDLVFSAPDTGNPDQDRLGKHKRKQIRDTITEAGLVINHSKTQVQDLQDGPIRITGMQLNPSGFWQLPTGYQRRAKAHLETLLLDLQGTQPLDEEEISALGGLYGLIKSSLDSRRVLRTGKETELLRLYERIKRRQASLKARQRRAIHSR